MTTNTPASEVPWTKGEWHALPPFGKSFDDHGYRAVAKLERGKKQLTIYAEAKNMIVEDRGCVWGDIETDALLIAESPTMAALLERANTSTGCHTVMWQQEVKALLSRIRSVK